jgi:5'-3' exonuclease
VTQDRQPVYLVDSSIYVFRSWFVLPDSIVDRDDQPINAVIGFTDFVFQLLRELRPSLIGFAFDESLSSSHRNDIYPEYKANRESAPEELKRQFAYCRKFLRSIGIPEFASDRYEADDLIGTQARIYRAQGHDIHILTGDKDLAQLVRNEDTWWDYARNNRLNAKGIEKKFGVRPEQIADQLAIAGDKVDNIPGIPGIGMTTAARLLNRFGDLANLLDNIEAISTMKTRGAKRLQELVDTHQEIPRLSRQLTTIHDEVDIELPSLSPQSPDLDELESLMTQLAFSPSRRTKWLNQLSQKEKA